LKNAYMDVLVCSPAKLDRFAFGAIAQEPSLRGKHEGG
jgi:hypothetical protein